MLFMLPYNSFVILTVLNISLEMFAVFMCNTVNTEKYNLYKQEIFGDLQLCLRVERSL